MVQLSTISLLFILYCVAGSSSKVISSANIETLKLAHVVFRHGSRSPISSYHKDPYNNSIYWPDGLGQLTAKGKQQEFELGRYLRWRYEKFIDGVYRASDVYAKSSDIDRAIMSGQLVLAGMFPPNTGSPSSMWNPGLQWQPVPIHTLSPSEDNKIAFTANCPRYEQMFYNYLNSGEMAQLNKEYDYMYKYLTTYAKTNISNVLAASDLYDVFFVQELHNLTLPHWAQRYYPEKLKAAAETLWDIIVATNEMKKLRGGALVGEFLLNIESLVNEKKNRVYPNPSAKLYLYSGHDSTIATTLGTLGVFESQIPPYSSAVIFELHQEKASSENPGAYFVKVFFRNETEKPPYELQIPHCGNPCGLDIFKKLFYDIAILDWGTWNHECQLQFNGFATMLETFYTDSWPLAALTFLVGFLTAALIFSIIMTISLRRSALDSSSNKTDGNNRNSATPSTCSGTSHYSVANNNYKHFVSSLGKNDF